MTIDSFKFVPNVAELCNNDDMLYDLFYGGYIVPAKVLVDKEQAEKVQEAVDIITLFIESLSDELEAAREEE